MKTTTPKVTGYGTAWQLWLDGKDDLLAVWNMPPSSEDASQHARQRDAVVKCQSFYGASEATARQVISEGWSDGAKLVERLSTKIEAQLSPPKSRRRTRKWSEDGDEISFERLQLGQDAWLSSHRKLRSACGLVEIVASWGEGCGASQGQLQWSGAAALALTDLLEKADYSVELCLVAAMHSDTNLASLVRVDIKRMGELIDLEQLAAIAVYPPAWRIYGLAAFQLAPTSSGTSYNSHPHAEALAFEPNGMWRYRPNVMTVELAGAMTEDAAVASVTDAIRQLDSQVNPVEDFQT